MSPDTDADTDANTDANTDPDTDLVRVDMGGHQFTTHASTLSRFGDSALLRAIQHQQRLRPERETVFLDRDPEYLRPVLQLYRCGSLHLAPGLCWFHLRDELEFWGLDGHDHLAPCCAPIVAKVEEKESMVRKMLGQLEECELLRCSRDRFPGTHRLGRARHRAWMFLEYPTSSRPAMLWGLFFLSIVLLAIFLEMINTLPENRVSRLTPHWNISNETNPKIIMVATSDISVNSWVLEVFCLTVFVLEAVARLVTAPSKLQFIKCAYTIIDLVCIVASLFLILIENCIQQEDAHMERELMYALNLFSVFRILRLFKFLRHFLCVQVLFLALRASLKEIGLVLVLLAVGTLLFAYLIYFAEFHTDDEFATIPVGFWWAIITMTTVGYGDKVPRSVSGRMIGSTCAIFGMIMIGIPIPAISSNFSFLYSVARTKNTSDKWRREK